MKKRINLTISGRMALTSGILLFIVLIIVGLSVISSNNSNETLRRINDLRTMTYATSTDVKSNLKKALSEGTWFPRASRIEHGIYVIS